MPKFKIEVLLNNKWEVLREYTASTTIENLSKYSKAHGLNHLGETISLAVQLGTQKGSLLYNCKLRVVDTKSGAVCWDNIKHMPPE